MASMSATIVVRFKNPEVLVAVCKLRLIIDEIVEDMPWRDDAEEANECLRIIQQAIELEG